MANLREHRVVGNIVVGIVGAIIAGWLLPMIGGGILGAIINATIGAMMLLFEIGASNDGATALSFMDNCP